MKRFQLFSFSVLSFCFCLSGTAGAAPSQQVLDLIAKTYDPQISAVEEDATEIFSLCRRTTVTLTAKDPITLQPGTVTLQMYVRKLTSIEAEQKLKTVIVMPPTGGETVLDRGYAGALCVAGFRSLIVQHWSGDNLADIDLSMHDIGARRSLAAVRHVIEFLKLQRPEQLGIMGNSVGAITASLVLGYDRRVTAGALIVGGIGMPEIIANSTEQNLTKLRAARKQAFQYSDIAAYQADLEKHIQIDPKDFIGLSGPKKIWTSIGLKDVTVPTKNQYDLYEAFGSQPDLYTVDGDHIATIIRTSLVKTTDIVGFFERTLK